VTCDLGGLANGATADKTVTVLVGPGAAATLHNTATVAGTETDPSLANNTSNTVDTAVTQGADVSVDLTAAPDPVTAGGDLTYHASVHNAGPSHTTGVLLTTIIPAGTTFEPGPSSAGCTLSAGAVFCPVGSLAATATVSKTVVVSTTGITAPSVVGQAIVGHTGAPELDPSNNSDSVTTTVNQPNTGKPTPGASASVTIGKIKVKKNRIRATFKGSGDFAKFMCRIDAHHEFACTSPLTRKIKKPGNHKLTVLVYNSAGALVNTASKKFKIPVPKKK
jgi:uncharacterized repeat protein (TIGR01451 family)